MKYDFSFINPTKIYFGRTALNHLGDELDKYGENVLLIYGGGSIKKIGLYDSVISILNEHHKVVTELSGVMPNPTYKKVCEGAELVRRTHTDLILAVGGGSVIDAAKAVSASAYCLDEDPYEKYWIRKEKLANKVVPIGDILTMVGTGSECNGGSVITNEELKVKRGKVFGEELFPRFAILNPEITYTCPLYQMRAGIFDILSHLMENYFSPEDDGATDYIIEGLMKCVIENTYKANANPEDYEARGDLMWCASLALNRMCGLSKEGDWQVHALEHQLSAYTDATHGMGLSALSIPYYKLIYKYNIPKFKRFAINVFNVEPIGTDEEIALKGIDALKKYILDNEMVLSIRELGITSEEECIEIAKTVERGGGYHDLSEKEAIDIYLSSYHLDY